ncbi:MucBP domain-containing protein [Enterococcus faecalis]|uniref:MucBP domain-containing protein n=7 Tax=Enterococcus TaxID=1350 RepID=UPI0035CAAE51
MFREKNTEKKLKFAIRKKKGGGGAASFVIGSLLFSTFILGGGIYANAEEITPVLENNPSSASTQILDKQDNESTEDKNILSTQAETSNLNESKLSTTENVAVSDTNTIETKGEDEVDSTDVKETNSLSVENISTDTSVPVQPSEKISSNNVMSDIKEETKEINLNEGSLNDKEINNDMSDEMSDGKNGVEKEVSETPSTDKIVDKKTESEENSTVPTSSETTERAVFRSKRDLSAVTQQSQAKFKINDIKFNKSIVVESKGTDLDVLVDWEGKELKKGDVYEIDMPPQFDSITKNIESTFNAGDQRDFGKLTLDYTNRKIKVEILQDVDPNKIYYGKLNIGTFIDRNYYKKYQNLNDNVIFNTTKGERKVPLSVIFDVVQDNQDSFKEVYSVALKDIDGTHMKWAALINKGKNPMTDLDIFLSPDTITGIQPTFKKNGDVESNNVQFEKNEFAYRLDSNSIEVYEANIFDSFGYIKGKKLVLGKDYLIEESISQPGVFLVRLDGSYRDMMDKSLVVEYVGENLGSVDSATTDNLVSYYDGAWNERLGKHEGNFNANWNSAYIALNSSHGDVMSKKRRGSVTVIHVAEDTGKLLKQESYIQENALVGTPYKATKEDFSKEGYSFAHMGYTSAPEEGTVKEGRQTVIYYYHKIQIPQEKKGSVILKYVDQDGNEIGRKQVAKIDSQKVGTLYSIDRDNDEGHKELLASGWDFVRVEKASDPESGEVQEWTKQVVYVYKKTQGSVKVKYVDEAGIEIPGATTKVVKTGKDGEAYKIDTQDRGENKAISGYTFVRKEEASDPEEGVLLNKDDKVVVYVYKKDVAPILPKGSITYVYVDDTGKEITREENKEQNLEVNKEHAISTDETINKNQKEYTKVFAPEKVTVKEGENIVYVLYKEKQTPVAPQPKEVTIVYVDQDGNEIGNKKVTGNEGETVTINADEKVTSNDGTKSYEKVKNQEDKVVVTPGENKVVVVYKDVTPKTAVEKEVTIVYVDQDGNEIGNKKVTGNEGETVTIDADEKVTSNDGTKSYEKVKNQEDKVVVTPGENKVVVVYKDVTPKTAVEKEVTIVYVDQDGNEIGNKKVTGNEGETVTIDADEKVTSNDGTKSYEKVKNQEDKVVVTPGENKVVVVYKDVTPKTAVEKEVTIVYVDQDGNEIGNKKVTGNEGETVTIDADEKVTSNDGTKSYEKVKNQEDKVVVTPGENKVVVVYKDVTPKTAVEKEVTIVYVDQDGNEIGNKKVTGNEGETVTIDADEKVTSNDGTKSYEKVKNQEDKVVVTPGENKVVVVYKDVTPKTAVEKEVTIVYVDQDGNEIGNKKVTGNEGETVTIDADEKVTSNDGTKSYEKVKNQEDKVVVTPGENKVVVVYKDVTPKTAVEKEVTIVYVDQDGNEIGNKKVTGNEGETVTINADEKVTSNDGTKSYEKVKNQEDKVVVTPGENKVVVVYKDVTPKTAVEKEVTIVYVDQDGNEIGNKKVTGNEGETVTIDADEKVTSNDGTKSYEKVKNQEDKVVVTPGENKVVVVYKDVTPKTAVEKEVTIVYVDQDGNEIGNKKVTGNEGETVTIDADEKVTSNDGTKSYEKVKNQEDKVVVTPGENKVVVVYKDVTPKTAVEKEVTIVYVDQDGNEIGNKKVTGNEGETVTINADEKVTSNDGTKSYEKVKNQEDKVVVTPGENKVVVVYKDVTPKTAVEKEVTIVYVDQDGNEIGNKKVTGNEGETVTIDADEKVTSNDGTKSYEKVKNQEDKVVVTPGENKVVVVYKDVTPKTATTDSSSQTDSLPDPICPVPVKPDMTDNGTQTDPKEPGVDGGTQTDPKEPGVDGGTQTDPKEPGVDGGTQTDPKEPGVDGGTQTDPKEPGVDGGTQTDPKEPGVDGGTQTDPKEPGVDGGTQTDPKEPGVDGGTQTDPKEPGVDGGTQTDPKEPGVDGGTQTDPKEPGVDGGTLVYKNNFKKIGDNIPQENSSLHQVSHKVAQNSEKRSDKIVSTEKEFPKTGEKQDNMLGLGLASITVAGLIALRMRKRRED